LTPTWSLLVIVLATAAGTALVVGFFLFMARLPPWPGLGFVVAPFIAGWPGWRQVGRDGRGPGGGAVRDDHRGSAAPAFGLFAGVVGAHLEHLLATTAVKGYQLHGSFLLALKVIW